MPAADPQIEESYEREEPAWLYDLVIWTFSCVFQIFFRKIQLRGTWRIPRNGPVIFVGAPHSNQFVDPVMILISVKENLGRRVSFLIAEKSYKQPVIGSLARDCRAIPVGRAQDNLKVATGSISYREGSTKVEGSGTKFTKECHSGVSLSVRGDLATVAKVISDTELELAKPFKKQSDFEHMPFKVAEKVDNTRMFKKVFEHLAGGHSIGIFPEGGSHDRTTLLPLKPGVAIMALGTMAQHPDANVAIVPVGMNYFHPHKFRSRAVIEFGEPFYVEPELVKEYRDGNSEEKRDSVAKLLSKIADALELVTIQAPDYETLMVVQACQRLYRPSGPVPLPLVVEFTRRFVKGYNRYKDLPKVQQLYKSVQGYNHRLATLGITDHQVPAVVVSRHTIFLRFMSRIIRLLFCAVLALPGTVISSPILVATKWYSKRKAAAALKASTVKIAGNDILATWKMLVGMIWTPLLYMFYSCVIAYYVFTHTSLLEYSFVNFCIVFWSSLAILTAVSLATLVVSDIGMDLLRSIVPLYIALNPWKKDALDNLRKERAELRVEITDVVNELGPELFPNLHEEMEALAKDKTHKEYHDDPRTDIRGLFSSLDLYGDYIDLGRVPIFGNDGNGRDRSTSLLNLGQTLSTASMLRTGEAQFDLRHRKQPSDASDRDSE